jgi:hypothetical protein
MLTLRHILRYTPAAILGLLVAMWIATCLTSLEVNRGGRVSGGWGIGSLFYTRDGIGVDSVYMPFYFGISEEAGLHAGSFWYAHDGFRIMLLSLPIPLLISLAAPLAIGPFIAFRFRLWHYLAYTALLAVELAYYLRWQSN